MGDYLVSYLNPNIRDSGSQTVSRATPLPVQLCPTDYQSGGVLGHYSIDAKTGSIGAGAATNLLFYARNTSASVLVAITELSMTGAYATTAYAVGPLVITASFARSFTAENGTPGGTALTITGNNQKQRTSMSTTSMAVIRIASTSALAAPVWSLDSQAFGDITSHTSAGWNAATPIVGNLYLPRTDLFEAEPGDHPLLLAQNEGVGIQVTQPATGVGIFGFRMKWVEVAAY